MTYFTSDQHFGHANIIRFCKRPFKTVEEMDEAMLAKWNAKVADEDDVWIEHPQFADRCSMEKLSDRTSAYWTDLSDRLFEHAWNRLIRDQPQFAKWREA